jgi:hypothetical protein
LVEKAAVAAEAVVEDAVAEILDATVDEPVVDERPQPDMSWLKRDLLAYAQDLRLDVDNSNTKAQIIAAIEAA